MARQKEAHERERKLIVSVLLSCPDIRDNLSVGPRSDISNFCGCLFDTNAQQLKRSFSTTSAAHRVLNIVMEIAKVVSREHVDLSWTRYNSGRGTSTSHLSTG